MNQENAGDQESRGAVKGEDFVLETEISGSHSVLAESSQMKNAGEQESNDSVKEMDIDPKVEKHDTLNIENGGEQESNETTKKDFDFMLESVDRSSQEESSNTEDAGEQESNFAVEDKNKDIVSVPQSSVSRSSVEDPLNLENAGEQETRDCVEDEDLNSKPESSSSLLEDSVNPENAGGWESTGTSKEDFNSNPEIFPSRSSPIGSLSLKNTGDQETAKEIKDFDVKLDSSKAYQKSP